MIEFAVILVMELSIATTALILADMKNRSALGWIGLCVLMPPALVVLATRCYNATQHDTDTIAALKAPRPDSVKLAN